MKSLAGNSLPYNKTFSSLHKGPNYIKSNQTYLHSSKHREKQLKREHNNIMNVIAPYLVRVHHMSNTSPIIKEFSRQIETYLHQRYMAPLSYCDIYRIQREFNLIQSIQSGNAKFMLPFISFLCIFFS